MSSRNSPGQSDNVLTAAQHLLRTLIDALPERIFVKDRQSRFLLNNAAHLKALGASSQDESQARPILISNRPSSPPDTMPTTGG